MLAIPALAGSSAYAAGETFKWRIGLERKPRGAKRFYAVIAGSTLLGLLMNFVPLSPIKALFWSAVLNGVVAVPLMITLMLIARNKKIMGQFLTPRLLSVGGWAATALMASAAIGLFLTL